MSEQLNVVAEIHEAGGMPSVVINEHALRLDYPAKLVDRRQVERVFFPLFEECYALKANLKRVTAERDAALAQYDSVKAKPEWATKDPFMISEFLRENSVFNAELVIEMLEFAIEVAKQQAEGE